MNELGQLLRAKALHREAEPLMRRVLGIFLKFAARTGREHPRLRLAQSNYAALLRAMGRTEEEIRTAVEELKAEVAAEGRSSTPPEEAP